MPGSRQREALLPFELTHSDFVVLARATWYSDSETLTQARLAELSGVDPMATSQIVRALDWAALLKRYEHPDDPRAKAITVTPAGREKARAAHCGREGGLRILQACRGRCAPPGCTLESRLQSLGRIEAWLSPQPPVPPEVPGMDPL
jgi:DNA-binding MarR family transcriptional regulator